MITRLVLIRHGITEWNLKKRYCGRIDVGLSKLGRLQVKALARSLEKKSFHKIYASDRRRALETAGILFGSARIIKVKGLREMNFGILEGLRHKEILEKIGSAYKNWLADPYKYRIPKAEPLPAFQKRVKAAVKKIACANRGKCVAVVCHGGTIGVLVSSILKKKNFWRYIPSAASATILEIRGNSRKIKWAR